MHGLKDLILTPRSWSFHSTILPFFLLVLSALSPFSQVGRLEDRKEHGKLTDRLTPAGLLKGRD